MKAAIRKSNKREWYLKKRAERKANNLCTVCGAVPSKVGETRCVECAKIQNELNIKSYRNKKGIL